MAEENQSVYDKAKKDYFVYQTYVIAEQQIKDRVYPQNLPGLAAKVVEAEGIEKGKIDEDLVGSLSRSTNFPALSGFVKPGVKRFGKNHKENFKGDNLERIIEITPNEKLQANLLDVDPEENSKYQDIVELHKEASEMLENFRAYSSKETSEKAQKLKIKAFENIQQTSVNYFSEIYKDNPSLLNAISTYIQGPDGEQLILNKYIKIASGKTKEFHDKIKGKEVEYARAVLGEENAPAFYEMVFRSDVAQEDN